MPTFPPSFRRCAASTLALAVVAATSPSAAARPDPFADVASIADEQLDRMRGGFENAQGLQFSFAIERAVMINGELVASTRIVLNDLGSLLTRGIASADLIESARSIVQSGAGNIAAVPPATTSSASAATAASASGAGATAPAIAGAATNAPVMNTSPAPVTAPAAAPASPPVGTASPQVVPAATLATPTVHAATAVPPAAVATTPAAAQAAAVGPLYVQINAAGQTVLVPNGAAIAAAVQNTVNNHAHDGGCGAEQPAGVALGRPRRLDPARHARSHQPALVERHRQTSRFDCGARPLRSATVGAPIPQGAMRKAGAARLHPFRSAAPTARLIAATAPAASAPDPASRA